MFFKPNFCANCGEKIERADWGIFTSRRFCQVCESEFKGQDLIPRMIVGVALLIIVFGFGSYLKTGPVATNALAVRQPAKQVEQKPAEGPVSPSPITTEKVLASPATNLPQTPTAQPASNQALKPSVADEPLYYCGAETKKGTPCTRRVKGNTRCFQHKGMPAMLPAEKLRIG